MIGIILHLVKMLMPEIFGFFLLMFFILPKGGLSITSRVIGSFVVIAIYSSVRVGDPYLGKMYTQKLCDENSTFEVSKTVTIPGSYWNENGFPKFTGSEYVIEGVRYQEEVKQDKQSAHPFFEIHPMTVTIVNSSTKEVLGKSVTYRLFRSWYERLIGTSWRAKYRCGGYSGKTNTHMNSLEMQVFQPDTEVHQK